MFSEGRTLVSPQAVVLRGPRVGHKCFHQGGLEHKEIKLEITTCADVMVNTSPALLTFLSVLTFLVKEQKLLFDGGNGRIQQKHQQQISDSNVRRSRARRPEQHKKAAGDRNPC